MDKLNLDLAWEIYNDIYLTTFYDEHDNEQTPVSFDEFCDNELSDDECREWYMSIYELQNS